MPEENVLACYSVGDCDYVTARDGDEARAVLAAVNGDESENYADWDVELIHGSMLDKPWCKDDRHLALREWLAAATEPAYLAGTE